MVKVVDSHPCGWGSIPGKSCSFLIVSLSKDLSLCFTCSDQHVKYRIYHGFPSTSSLLLDYYFKQHTYTYIMLAMLYSLIFLATIVLVVVIVFSYLMFRWRKAYEPLAIVTVLLNVIEVTALLTLTLYSSKVNFGRFL